MKHLKAKLMATVVSLILAALMLTSASFAWFTISTKPEISDIKTKVAANGNLEIALSNAANFATPTAASGTSDAGKNITWGNLVDLNAYFSSANFELKPVEVDLTNKKVSIPEFGLDGRISKLNESTGTWTSLMANPSGNFSDGGIVVYEDSAGTPWAFRVDFFMRTNTVGSVTLLKDGADRGAKDSSGAGTTITSGSKVTVAFKVDDGNIVKFYDGTAATPAWDFTTPLFTDTVSTINTAHKVSMYVYYDGAGLTNATMETAVKDMALNVQFTHSETLTPVSVQGVDYDKPTPGGGGV